MKIHRATIDDLDSLAVLFDEYRKFYNMDPSLKDGKDFLEARLNHHESVVFIATADDGIKIGFTQLYPLFSSTRLKRLWLLNDLYVLPEFRGSGVASGLIVKAKELCISSNACGLSLETAAANTEANRLYIKTGFHADHEHNFYFWTNNESNK